MKIDRRQQKTKQALLDALLTCIQAKGLDHVTVTDLANEANINRGTFYLHYQDVRHMVNCIMDEKVEEFRSHIALIHPLEHQIYNSNNAPYPHIVSVLEFINRDRNLFKVILGPKGNPSYQQYFKNILMTMLSEKFKIEIQDGKNPPVPVHYLLQYMTSAVVGMIMYWIENDLPEKPMELAKMISSIANHGLIVSAGLKEQSK